MKKLLFTLVLGLMSFVLCSTSLQAQTIPPPYINYQAVLYDVNGANPNSPLTNQSFSTFVNINDELGNLLYREEHYASTDANGLITVKMGDGLYTAGPITNFNQINWGVGKYYLVVDFDINGTISSTAPEQLVTVPYSFYAGNAGNGMTAVADNGNGTLTFTYANGATYTTPTLSGIQGPAGPVGPSGPSGPSGASGADGQSAYDLWLAQGNIGTVQDFLSTSAYQIWLAQGNTGTAQDFLNTLVGPSGPQGIQGIAGTNGTNGATGPQGPQGLQGIQGVAGINGINGTNGRSAYEIAVLNGFVGTETQWLLSLVGATGPQGIPGTNGANGATGPQGQIGLTGPQGPQGIQGLAGSDGATGSQGPIGLTGPQGPQGIQGPVGNDGATGPQGPAGNDGATGPQGPAGNDGATGPQGPIGLTGPQGAQGLLDNGTAAGNTPYWNGSQWVVNGTNFYNNGGSLGVGTIAPDASSKLEVNSTTQGFLPPRLTTSQRDAIVSPAIGLVIFNTTTNCLNFFVGSGWNETCGTLITTGTIITLNCAGASFTGTLTSGTAASGVSASVPYTGGNGGSYAAQTISSTGVTGLTATLTSGILANGSGSLSFAITGSPSASGTASFALTIGGQSCSFTISVQSALAAQYSASSVFCASGPTAIVDVTNPTTGKIWMDRNLGASQVATSSTDAAAYGDLYQWGRGNDGHQCSTSATTATLSSTDQPGIASFILAPNTPFDWRSPQNTNLWQGVNGVNNPCPSGYRIPTETELNAERLSWTGNNASGSFNSLLKLTLAGYRIFNSGVLDDVAITGHYWSSSVDVNNTIKLYFNNTIAFTQSELRGLGFSVRCIKDASAIPATLGAINCGSTSITGTLTSGTAASSVSASVPYTGGNGGSYAAQTISSTGVTGLTATLTAGILANGAGSLSFAISGTPASSGTSSFSLTIGGQSCSFTVSVQTALAAQYSANSVFCASGPTAIVDVTNPTTGKIWMDRNLGASQVATSSTDVNSYGDLYQWGRRSDGHQCRTSATTATLSSTDTPANGNFILAPSAPYDWRSQQNTNLWQGVNGVNNPCPSGYRIPTETEINAERLSWSQNNIVGAFASSLKLSMAGYRDCSIGSLVSVGASGRYWSSTVSGVYSRTLLFNNSLSNMRDDSQAYGLTVRCIKDASAIPATLGAINCGSTSVTGTLTSGTAASGVSASVPYTGGNGGSYAVQTISSTGVTGLTATLTAGILANGAGSLSFVISGTPATSGTASFALTIGGQSCSFTVSVQSALATQYPANSVFCASGPTAIVDVTSPTGKIWMDRNLGASQVATSSTDAAAYGDLYQWGRGNDGHQCRNSATTASLSSSDTPGNANFITAPNSPFDWRSPQNANLWQGVNGVNNPCPTGYRVPTETELNAERLSWTVNSAPGAFASPLKFSLTGVRNFSGFIISSGAVGGYWVSSINGAITANLSFDGSGANMDPDGRAGGYSVRCIKDASAIPATLGAINCGSTSVTGTLTSGTAASGVSASVPYTGGNGGSYAAQTISSTGVTGLTATLTAGILANGAGSLSFAISGTPATSGTASFALTIGGQSCSFTVSVQSALAAQYPANSVFCASGPTAIVDVTSPTGKIWMDRNLGASQVATSSTDAAAYGDLYQWGRGNDGHQCRNSATTSTLSSTDTPANGNFILSSSDWRSPQNNNLWQGVNGVNNPCPTGYRVPTETELNNERLSWSNINGAGAFSNALKWTQGGGRSGVGLINSVGSIGVYWSSTIQSLNSIWLRIENGTSFTANSIRADAVSVRCIKDASAIPATLGAINCGSSSVTGTLTSGTAASGVSASVPYTGGNGGSYAAQTISSTGVTGLTATLTSGILANGAGSLSFAISGTPATSGTASFALTIGGQSCSFTISVAIDLITAYPTNSVFCASGATAIVDVTNPTTGKIWMDRNLGASQAATSSTDAAAYGDLYQWGRRSDGHQCRTSATTTTLSSTDTPANGNFIIVPLAPGNWRNPANANLWQGVNGVNNPCPNGYRIPTEAEFNGETSTLTSFDTQGAYASILKWVPGGYRDWGGGSLAGVGTYGGYWASNASNPFSVRWDYNASGGMTSWQQRAHGHSVRCIKN